MSNQTETELLEATAAAIKEPRPKTDLEKAREKIGPLKEALEKDAIKNNWDIAEDENFTKTGTPPKVRFFRRATVGDSIRAEEMARVHYGVDKDDYKPTGQQITIAKLCLICTFDGAMFNILQAEKLGEDFFTNIVVRFSEYLGS